MTDFKFYKFIEDFRPSGTLSRECNYLGEVYKPTSTARRIKAGFNRPVGANAGYFGLCYRGTFYWGPCPNLSCDKAASTIDLGTPPEATVNETYEHEIVVTDFSAEPTITGLPDGLTATIEETDDDEWTITITGTPTTEGEFTIIVSGTTLENSCPMAAAFNLIVNPCDVGDSEIDIGELPEATQFEEYDHEITFTDVDDIEILGLPEEIEATIGSGTITLHSDELPAESVWQVTIRGTTPENGCPIEVQFTINIGPCDAGDSYYQVPSQTRLTWFLRRNAVDCCLGIFNAVTIFANLIDNISASGLPSWLDLETISETEVGSQIRLQGSPTTDSCEADDSAFTDGTQLGTLPIYYWDVELTGESIPNDCQVKTTIRVWLTNSCYECPDPTDHEALGASIENGEANVTIGDELIAITLDNVVPSSIVITSGADLEWSEADSWVAWLGVAAPGSYVTTLTGTVDEGEHAGCPISHTFTVVIS